MPISQAPILLRALDFHERRFLYGLDQTPDNHLTYSPGEARKSPLQIAGELTGFLTFIANTLAGHEAPTDNAWPPDPTSRDAAKTLVAGSCAALRRSLERLEPADLQRQPPPPWSEETLEQVLWEIGGTIMYFQGQLNYVQLCYGDWDVNIPPDSP